jgi:hypothetical protein
VTDQNAPYLVAILIVMFLAGCVLVVVSLRERLRERDRWFSPAEARSKNRSTAAKGAMSSPPG